MIYEEKNKYPCDVGTQLYYFGFWGISLMIYCDRVVTEVNDSGLTSVVVDCDTGEYSDKLFIPWTSINQNVFLSYESAEQVMKNMEIHSVENTLEIKPSETLVHPIQSGDNIRICPNCNSEFEMDTTADNIICCSPLRCPVCNQIFDWSTDVHYVNEDF